MEPNASKQAKAVLERYGLENATVKPVSVGLINLTYEVENSSAHYILQRVNPIFPAEIHADIAVVTETLAQRGLATPRLLPNESGELCSMVDGEIWRLLSHVDGRTLEVITEPAQASAAAAVLARFHGALWELNHLFQIRPSVRDTAGHLKELAGALQAHHTHARYREAASLAKKISRFSTGLRPLPIVAERIAHGDPKISNVIFEHDSNVAICLVDLDTLGPMALPLELGDAVRSWCNPYGEDSKLSFFSVEIFKAVIEGYASYAPADMERAEWQAIATGTETIFTELAARFCADALNECYFGWDANRFESRSEHNLVRATGQLAAAVSLRAQRQDAAAVIARYAPV